MIVLKDVFVLMNEIDKVMLMLEKEIVQLFVELIIDQFHKNVFVHLFEIVIILLLIFKCPRSK